jgi:hypothetical protein
MKLQARGATLTPVIRPTGFPLCPPSAATSSHPCPATASGSGDWIELLRLVQRKREPLPDIAGAAVAELLLNVGEELTDGAGRRSVENLRFRLGLTR